MYYLRDSELPEDYILGEITLHTDILAEPAFYNEKDKFQAVWPIYEIKFGEKVYILPNLQRKLSTYFENLIPQPTLQLRTEIPRYTITSKYTNDTRAFEYMMKILLGFGKVKLPKEEFINIYILIDEFGIKTTIKSENYDIPCHIDPTFKTTLNQLLKAYFDKFIKENESREIIKFAISNNKDDILKLIFGNAAPEKTLKFFGNNKQEFFEILISYGKEIYFIDLFMDIRKKYDTDKLKKVMDDLIPLKDIFNLILVMNTKMNDDEKIFHLLRYIKYYDHTQLSQNRDLSIILKMYNLLEGNFTEAQKNTLRHIKSTLISGNILPMENSNEINSALSIEKDKLYITGSSNGTITIRKFDPDNNIGIILFQQKVHESSIYDMIYLPPNEIASCSCDNRVKIWNSTTGVLKKVIRGSPFHTTRILTLVQLSDSIILTGSDNGICKWNIKENDPSTTAKIISNNLKQRLCFKLAMLSQIEILASSGSDVHIYAFEPDTIDHFRITRTLLSGNKDQVYSINRIQDNLVVTGTSEGLLKLWKPRVPLDKNPLWKVVNAHTSSIFACPIVLHQKYMISFANDIKVWDIEDDDGLELSSPIARIGNDDSDILTACLINKNAILFTDQNINLARW